MKQTTGPSALALTESVALYMASYFHNMIQGSNKVVQIPMDWNSHILHECHQALFILKQAYDTQSKQF